MKSTRRSSFAIALAMVLLFAGCAHRVGSTQPVTPWEKAVTSNALIAETNSGAQKEFEAIAPTLIQTKAITPQTAGDIMRAFGQVSQAHKEITAILRKGKDLQPGDQASLQSLLAQIKQSSRNMISTGAIGVKNPQSQVTVQQQVEAVAGLVDLIILNLQTAGVLK